MQQKEMFAAGGRLVSSPFHAGNLFTLLHVAVCAQLLKASHKKEVFLSHYGINKILALLLKLLVIHDNMMVLFWGLCTMLWSIFNHHAVQKPLRRPQLDKQPP
jgi:hypothetical protein